MQLKKVVPASLAVLLMAGCSSVPEKAQIDTPPVNEKLENAKEKLAECLSADGFKEFYRNCNSYTLNELPQESQQKASEKWRAYLAEGGPDFQLLAAVESEDLKGVTEAINAGADVNRLFTDATVFGADARDPNDKQSILFIASQQMNLELMAVLFDAGADPNLRYGPEGSQNDFVYQSYWKMEQQWDVSGQRIIDVVYGPDIGLLALEYGYVPTDKILDSMERRLDRNRASKKMKAKMSELYSKLLQVGNEVPQQKVSDPESKAEELCKLHQQMGQEAKHKYPMAIGDGNQRFLDRSEYNSEKDVCEVTLRYETSVNFWAKVVMNADQRYDMALARKFVRSDKGHSLIGTMMTDHYKPQFGSMDRPEMDVTLEVSFKNNGLETKRFPMFSD